MKLQASFVVVVCLAIAGIGLASPVAQDEPGTISQVWFLKIKPGMEADFEAAMLQHWDVHRQHNDPRPYTVFMIEDGDRAGWYGVITSGNHWADLDTFEATVGPACAADFAANAAPLIESLTAITTAGLPHVSNAPGPGSPFNFAQVYEYHLDFGASVGFIGLLEKAKKAADETGWPWNYSWSTLVSGGEGPVFYVVAYLENWAAFAGPEQTFEAMLEEAYGSEGKAEIMEGLYESVESVSVWIARIRPDLSYSPVQQ